MPSPCPATSRLSETGYGGVSVLQLNGDNELASSSLLTFNAPLGGSRLELNGHAQTLSGINGDAAAVIEGLLDNTGLNSNSTLTVNNAADCTLPGSDPQQLQGSGTGKVNLIKNGGGSLLLGGVEHLQRLDDRSAAARCKSPARCSRPRR